MEGDSSGPLIVMPPSDAPRDADVVLPGEGPDVTALPEIRPRDPVDSGGYDDRPGLAAGELLAGQYRVVRRLGLGGMGDVYLALDEKVDDREVAVKTLRPGQLTFSAGALAEERQAFADLNHEGIIPVFNYGSHETVGDFLVLPYVDGLNLDEVRTLARLDPDRFGGPRFHEFVLAYGIRILSALDHLHARPPDSGTLVYGDLKPQNVMHDGAAIKVVDVGSIRPAGAPGLTTYGFRGPNVPLTPNEAAGASEPQDDLFSLGETLRTLCGLGDSHRDLAALGALGRLRERDALTARAALLTTTPAPEGLGLISLARVLRRATRSTPADRFADAREMDDQLRGVWRELRSLRTRDETFEPSPLFLQSPYALDGGLGTAPTLPRWAAPPGGPPAAGTRLRPARGDTAGPLHEPPAPADASARLPVPRPDPHDDHHAELSRLADADPAALLQNTADWRASPEVHLLRCRLRLRVALRTDPDDADLKLAEQELRGAVDAIGRERARHDWRIDWHQGLVSLARDDVTSARDHFDQVYGAIPGEYAPKLALGHCSELLGHREEALGLAAPEPGTDQDGAEERAAEHQRRAVGHWRAALTLYEAVRLRNPSLGSAAFGAARTRLALGGPRACAAAIEALDAVPQHSRHRTAARTATVRIAVEHVGCTDTLGEALVRLGRLFNEHGLTDEQARVRMKAEVWEAAQRLVTAGTVDAAGLGRLARETAARDDEARDAGARLEFPDGERKLGKDLSAFYLLLARQAARSGDLPHADEIAERLLDRAYLVRPMALRHRRDVRSLPTLLRTVLGRRG
ncbi:tetratricopeptide repeat protein [Streptomyces sp. KL116D]|uniref:tetratricopeptide repeat protein n=1 Tax=Streptomyces sp. KL116D TaxID=3045152 RepID=UPI00355885E1